MTSKLVKLMRDAEQRQWDWETIMDEAADRIAELEGALREIAERGERHLGGAGSVRVARAALRSEATPDGWTEDDMKLDVGFGPGIPYGEK
jgi:hypothetical protein